MRRAVRLLLGVIIVAAVLFLFVFPVRTLIDQRHQAAQAQMRIGYLSAENAALTKQAKLLKDPAYLEQIAEQRYGLVAPNQHEFIVTSPASSPTTTTPLPAAGH